MKVRAVMSPGARKISASATLHEALECMKRYEIRHLPVVDGPVAESSEIIGLLSEADTRLALALCQATGNCPSVGGVCSSDPYIVSSEDWIVEVVREMAEKKHDCALVADENDIFVGIVTTTDVCRLACMLLEDSGR